MTSEYLVPVDGSPSSKLAFCKAVQLAKITGAKIKLLYVEHDVDYYSRRGVLFAQSYYDEKEIKERSAKIFVETREGVDEGEVVINGLVLFGDPVRKIIAEAAQPEYDMIIMGNRGNKPFKGAVLGSVSANVVAGSIRPVLVVKDAQEELQQIMKE